MILIQIWILMPPNCGKKEEYFKPCNGSIKQILLTKFLIEDKKFEQSNLTMVQI